ncbi:hypothetical protein [Aquimarina sp. 2201CG14-23]|uniref:hypothetical protein n=1 Tax=Aquimarina mycalae TaxID=3040073 RepID=UPI0024781602|nr:hypothetical protein [Aquimarina sp. 2201CG14-23]MDH7444266.1 hypothetical protein [Aquimarina sp. 2201CG14-23]
MKNNKLWSLLVFALMLSFNSCVEDDGIDQDSDCPQLSFTQDGKVLFADFEELNNLEVYEWFVNDELVETENLQDQRDNKLDLSTYNPGTYNVCIKAETPDCPNGAEFCKEIVIEDENNESCPNLAYSREGDYLIADFEGIDTLGFYAWQVTGEPLDNESIIENEGLDFQGDNKFLLTNLQPGTYTICLISESTTCTQAEPFCKEIVVENTNNETCPDLSFIVEGTLMFANFSGIDQLGVYTWYVNGQLVETEDLQNQDRDNMLDLDSYNPGTYTVCIKAETTDCPNGTEFCVEVVIPEPQSIDCSVFDVINYKDTIAIATALSITDIDPNSIIWTIDGTAITPITPRVARLQDHVNQSGTYEICYKAVSQTCGTLEKCITIDYQG